MYPRGSRTDSRRITWRGSRWIAAAASTAILSGPLLPLSARAVDDAPGSPGASATWTTGDKDGLGTSTTAQSKVWYTLTGGTMSEVYYPSGDTPNVRELQFAVTDGTTSTQLETDGTVARSVALVDPQSLTYRQASTDKQGRWRLTKTYITDPGRSTVLLDAQFEVLAGGPYRLYALYDPSLAGDSGNDSGSTAGSALVSSDTHAVAAPTASALVASTGFAAASTGYVGSVSDGRQDLVAHHALTSTYAQAGPGNIAQVGEIPVKAGSTQVTLALGFAGSSGEALSTAQASLARPFGATRGRYQSGWHQYLSSLTAVPAALGTGPLATQYWASVMTLKAHEDKTFPGAFIASLTIPWGQAANADGSAGGYHAVWARDEYEQVSSLLAAGDTGAAQRAVNWLFTRQQEADGHFPQNSKVDGTPLQTNVQLDETAYPIVLAWQTGRYDKTFYTQHIAKAADYLVATGPGTPQERWEETGGYSPTTIADEIAGLTAAADIAARNGDTAGAAIYRATADSWQRQVEKWTYTTTGNLSDGRYYIRIGGSGNPDDGASRNWPNGAGVHPENSVVDAGFLELTRLGVKAPTDPYVAHSLLAVDQSIKVDTPSGAMWRRYTFDGYGEKADGSPWDGTGIGRPWPLLSGERGEYVLANGGDAMPYLHTMANSANDGYMIPEQVWDQADPTSFGHVFGEGTGSAAPLAWAMGQYVRLAQGIAAGKPVETPSVVAGRYATGQIPSAPSLTVTSPLDRSTATGRTVRVTGTTSADQLYLSVNGAKQQVPLQGGGFDVEVTLPDIRNQLVIAAVGGNGGTAQAVRTVLAFGDRVGGLTDPTGDDNGPGTYVYPTNPVYVPGIFDLTGTGVYTDGDSVRFVSTIAGPITNPFGGDQISHQRINIYLGSGTGSPVAALPGTNMNTATPWSAVVVADGRFNTAGVFAPDGTRLAGATLTAIPESRQIVATVPRSALGTLDLATARYGVAMFGNAEAGEGIGYIRPAYDLAYWQNPGPDFWWITQFRFGGGAGVWNDTPSHDSDTRDPNALDIVVGPGQTQSQVMDWQANSPVALPMVPLTS
jgi:glucan 1,4-alpha-glucosidase